MSKSYRVVSVRLDTEQYELIEEMKKMIEDKTNLPVSVHYIIKQSITNGCDALRQVYSSYQSTPSTLRL